MEEGLSRSEMWHRRRLLALMWGGVLVGLVGIGINVSSESLGLRALSLFGVLSGCALITLALGIEYQRVLGDLRELLARPGSLVPVEREALLTRLNRAANEYPDLWEVAGKLVIPVAVAVVTLVGVVVTVLVR